MGNHRCKCCTFGHLNGSHSLRQRPDLIEFDENRVGRMLQDPPLETLSVGYKEVIPHDLYSVTQTFAQEREALPVIFGQTIFDGDDWVLIQPLFVEVNHFTGGESAA